MKKKNSHPTMLRGCLHKTLYYTQADAFAITLEKRGGVASPTLTELYVMGKI